MKKLTLLIDDDVYAGLHKSVGRGHIGRFISDKVRPHLPAANDAAQVCAFGMLASLATAKPATEQGEARAKREYMRQRYANKLAP